MDFTYLNLYLAAQINTYTRSHTRPQVEDRPHIHTRVDKRVPTGSPYPHVFVKKRKYF
jgi:hypothetical protein